MKNSFIILCICISMVFTACSKQNTPSPTEPANTAPPSPTASVDEKTSRAVQIAAEAVKKSKFYSEDGKVMGTYINLNGTEKIELQQYRDKMCYVITFDDTDGFSLLYVVVDVASYEVLEVGQWK